MWCPEGFVHMDGVYGVRRETPMTMREHFKHMQTRDELQYPWLERGLARDLCGMLPTLWGDLPRFAEAMTLLDGELAWEERGERARRTPRGELDRLREVVGCAACALPAAGAVLDGLLGDRAGGVAGLTPTQMAEARGAYLRARL